MNVDSLVLHPFSGSWLKTGSDRRADMGPKRKDALQIDGRRRIGKRWQGKAERGRETEKQRNVPKRNAVRSGENDFGTWRWRSETRTVTGRQQYKDKSGTVIHLTQCSIYCARAEKFVQRKNILCFRVNTLLSLITPKGSHSINSTYMLYAYNFYSPKTGS